MLEVHPLGGVPVWRKEPYRLLFPLGVSIAVVGVGQWLAFAHQLTGYRSIFHAMAQVQGFLFCFITGFLFTFVPRRTFTAPPAAWQMAVALVCPVGVAATAWAEQWAVTQVFHLALVGVLLQFVVSRLLKSKNSRPADDGLVWVPAALSLSIVASVVTGAAAAAQAMWLHDLGRAALLQGVVASLVVGVGSLLVPVITRRETTPRPPSGWGKVVHLTAFAFFVLSFWVAGARPALGYGLRAAVAGFALVWQGRLWRPPNQPGLNPWLVWVAAWCVPLGFALAALFPVHWSICVHVTFIGGFAMIALSVGNHVIAMHANRPQLLRGFDARLVVVGLGLLGAVVMRSLLELDPLRYLTWMQGAAASFLVAAVAWLLFALPSAWGARVMHAHEPAESPLTLDAPGGGPQPPS